MHPDKKINYKIPDDCILEQLCFDSFEKVMKLQQQGNPNNHVVFDCQDGDSVYMSNRGRGINQYPSGVQVELGSPKKLMKAAGSVASINYYCYVNLMLNKRRSWFTNAAPTNFDSNSILSHRELSATIAVAP